MVEERKCSNCGQGIAFDARFCPDCGHKFQEAMISNKIINEGKKHNGLGIVSLVLGIIAMCLIWITFIPSVSGFYFFVHLPLGILAIIFGASGYWGKKRFDNYGLAGFILGLIVVIIGFIFVMIMVYVSGMISPGI